MQVLLTYSVVNFLKQNNNKKIYIFLGKNFKNFKKFLGKFSNFRCISVPGTQIGGKRCPISSKEGGKKSENWLKFAQIWLKAAQIWLKSAQIWLKFTQVFHHFLQIWSFLVGFLLSNPPKNCFLEKISKKFSNFLCKFLNFRCNSAPWHPYLMAKGVQCLF